MAVVFSDGRSAGNTEGSGDVERNLRRVRLSPLPPCHMRCFGPRLVMGAERDHIVDEAGVKEMATFLDTEHIMLPTVPHEVGFAMLLLVEPRSRCSGPSRRGNFPADVAISFIDITTECVNEKLVHPPEPPWLKESVWARFHGSKHVC